MNEIYNPQECETHLQNFEDKGYKILQEKGIKYIQIPLGNKYSESQLEKFAETIKLEFGNKKHIEMVKAHNFLQIHNLMLEYDYHSLIQKILKETDKAEIILKKSKDPNEILKAQKLLGIFEIGFEEGLYSL